VWVVQLALRRPYTFVVAALVLLLLTLSCCFEPDGYLPGHQYTGRERCVAV